MVVVGTGGTGTKILRRNYPIESGLTAGTTKQEGRDPDISPAEDGSTVLCEEFRGLN